MNNKQHIVMIQGNEQAQIPLRVLRCFGEVNNATLHIVSLTSSSSLRYSRIAKSFQHIPQLLTLPIFLDTIETFVRQYGSVVVMPTLIDDIRFVAKHRAEIGTITTIVDVPPLDSFNTVEDKWAFAQFLDAHNLSSPVTLHYSADPSFLDTVSNMIFPILLKPIFGSTGGGIAKFKTKADLCNYINEHGKNIFDGYIVQSFVLGYDIDCSVLCREGQVLAYTIQKGFAYTNDPYSPPAGIIFLENNRIIDLVIDVVAALNWSGVGHFDLRYDEVEDDFKVIELNPRYWASLTGSLYAGVNFPELAYRAALGEKFPMPEYQHITYIAFSHYMKGELRQYRRENPGIFDLSHTDFKQVLRDPAPDFLREAKKLATWVFAKFGYHPF